MELYVEWYCVPEEEFDDFARDLMARLYNIDYVKHYDGKVTFRATRPKSTFMAMLPYMNAMLLPYRYC